MDAPPFAVKIDRRNIALYFETNVLLNAVDILIKQKEITRFRNQVTDKRCALL